MTLYSLLVSLSCSHMLILGDGVFDKMNNQEVVDAAWDAARKTYKQHTNSPTLSSVHALCGQSIELVLKASVASRTLDNITGVIVAFKNFRKTIKNETALPPRLGADAFKPVHLNSILSLPNGDLVWEDIARPGDISKSEISLDTSALINHQKSHSMPAAPRIGSSQQKIESSQLAKRAGAGTGGGQHQVAS